VDFITKLPLSYGNDTILTIMDHDVSKASIFLPCKETIDAVGIAELYATHVFPYYGIPLKVISDRDPRFDSAFTTDLCRLLGIYQNISTTYHPQTDGQSERTNQSLETYLQLYYDTQQHEWAKLLPMAQYVRNSWPSSTTKQVPFNTLVGYTPLAHQPTQNSSIPSLQQRLEKIRESRTVALEAL
jgi:transposase InsO family protein